MPSWLHLWLKRVAIALGVLEAGAMIVRGITEGNAVGGLALTVVILTGAWLAWRHPVLMGGLLVLLGAVLTPSLVWAIDFGQAWTENPKPWGFSEYFAVVVVGAIPLLAGTLLLISAWSDRAVKERSENIRPVHL